jgi:hypothetical protein
MRQSVMVAPKGKVLLVQYSRQTRERAKSDFLSIFPFDFYANTPHPSGGLGY